MKDEAPAPLHCLIVDDERAAHKALKFHIDKVPWLHFSDSCTNAINALEAISATDPDIIFLDVDMPYISGIDLLNIIGKIGSSIIMTTAHEKFAIQGFDYNVSDFLLKPISFERFLKAANKVRLQRESQTMRSAFQDANGVQEYSPNHPFQIIGRDHLDSDASSPTGSPVFGEKIMWIQVEKDVFPLEYKQIYMVQSCGNYVRIYVKDCFYIIRASLTLLVKNLPPRFIQTHRSYIVNSELVKHISGNEITMTADGYMARISRELRSDIFKKLKSFYG